MEKNLFIKHFLVVEKQKINKENIINIIKEESGIILNEDDFILLKKEITLQLTSVKRSMIMQKKVIEALKEKGYILR